VIGYLAVWTGYSVGAAGLQWALHDYGLLSTGDTVPVAAGGGALMLAGLYQWSAVKYACLRHCRSPLGFFLSSWRDGGPGAPRMGFQHGLYCVGCCWALMGLSFVAGLMNLLWMAAVTVFVFVDHIFPSGLWLSRLAGAGLIVRGLWMIAESGLFF
jgi:predicted metal-binding membrane protein